MNRQSIALWVLGLVLACGGAVVGAQEPAGPAEAAQTDRRLQERDRYARQARELRRQGKLAEAIAAAERTLAIERELLAELKNAGRTEKTRQMALDVVGSLELLGELHEAKESDKEEPDFAAGRQARQEALELLEELYPPEHPQHYRVTDAGFALEDIARLEKLSKAERAELREAAALNRQVYQLWRAGRSREALPLARRSLEIRKKVVGDEHPDYATSLNNLCALYQAMGDYARAEPLYQKALEIDRKVRGEEHPAYANGLHNLAALYQAMGDYARAEPLYRQALEIRKKVLGEEHPDYATSLNNLAGLYQAMGAYARAEPLYRQALEITKKALGGEHPHYADTLHNFGHLYQVMAMWPDAVLARSVEERLARRQPELKPLVEKLAQVRTRWATLALAVPEPAKRAVWQRQLQELAQRKEDLESELARRSSACWQARGLQELAPAALAARLPERTVFVDFFVYNHYLPPQEKGTKAGSEPRLLAFVLRRGHEPAVLQLGPAEPIAGAVDAWRQSFGSGAASRQAAEDLARLVGPPLRPYLEEADTLLVAPDGPLCRFPLAVLPGRRAGTYLIEDLAIGYVASGRQLAELLAQEPAADESRPTPASGLLLAGGIRYDAAAAGGATCIWPPTGSLLRRRSFRPGGPARRMPRVGSPLGPSAIGRGARGCTIRCCFPGWRWPGPVESPTPPKALRW